MQRRLSDPSDAVVGQQRHCHWWQLWFQRRLPAVLDQAVPEWMPELADAAVQEDLH